ncbi:MAG: type II toxin-antitoxin system Phd/YefM family antitoxin [Candidatus Blackburnbacteria bacterium]|nr:type II toxin-antitoxin system Phd/YefM family antitoxin [Candidatus Blackburnbacteria bacterium]
MIKTLPITKARENFTDLVDRAARLRNEYTITVNGEPKAVLLSVDEYESLKETLEILSSSKLMRDIREAEAQVKRGDVVDWEDFKKETGW